MTSSLNMTWLILLLSGRSYWVDLLSWQICITFWQFSQIFQREGWNYSYLFFVILFSNIYASVFIKNEADLVKACHSIDPRAKFAPMACVMGHDKMIINDVGRGNSVIQGRSPQAKPKIFDFSPKTSPRHFKKRSPTPHPRPHGIFLLLSFIFPLLSGIPLLSDIMIIPWCRVFNMQELHCWTLFISKLRTV